MNIIKYQDILADNEFFNENLKGKYAVAFNFKYVFPLGVVNISENSTQIIDIEQQQPKEIPINELSIETLSGETLDLTRNIDYILYDEFKSYIDIPGADPIVTYIYLNNFTTDDDITLEELKRFRTWLAEVLLENAYWIEEYSKDPDKLRGMLVYYVQEMYDHTVKMLSAFGDSTELVGGISQQSGCGCKNQSVNLQTSAVSVCDPLLIYRHGVYKYMVEIFSDINYWIGQVDICGEMKKYIDNIIKVGLPLSSDKLYSNFADCTCINADTDEQAAMTAILNRLSQSLGFIIEDKVSGNRNFIQAAFQDWSTYLYEKMRW